MTPERIAELRDWLSRPEEDVLVIYQHVLVTIPEMLDEIERLRGLIEAAHWMRTEDDGAVWCAACFWNHDSTPCDGHRRSEEGAQEDCEDCSWWPLPPDDDVDPVDAHAAHVRQILDGGAR